MRLAVMAVAFTAVNGTMAAYKPAGNFNLKQDLDRAEKNLSLRAAQLETEFSRKLLEMQREISQELARLRADMLSGDVVIGAKVQPPLSELAAAGPRMLQAGAHGDELCSTNTQATAALNSIRTVCCEQRNETCTPQVSSCDHGRECGLAVESVEAHCGAFLPNSIYGDASLRAAVQVCIRESPQDSDGATVYTPGNYNHPTTVSNACSGIFRTQTGGRYRNNWNSLAILEAPVGFAITLKFRAFDLSEGDFIDIYDNRTAMESHIGSRRLEGSRLPNDITSHSDTMFIKFVTNRDGTAFGASADIVCESNSMYCLRYPDE